MDLSHFCCVCLNVKLDIKQLNINSDEDKEILDALSYCAYETAWIDNNIQLSVCFNCCCMMQVAYHFSEMCLKSSRLLKGYVSLSNLKQLKDGASLVRDNRETANENLNKHYAKILNHLKTQYSHVADGTVDDIISSLKKPNEQPSSNVESLPVTAKIKREIEPSPSTIKVIVKQEPKDVYNTENVLHEIPVPNVKTEILAQQANIYNNLHSNQQDNIMETRASSSKQNSFTPNINGEECTETHPCKKCGKIFHSKSMLKKHAKCHNQKIICKICSKHILPASEMNNHVRQYHLKKIKCSFCDYQYTLHEMKKHIRSHLLPNTQGVPCPLCNQKRNIASLVKHVKKHLKSEPAKKKLRKVKSKPKFDTQNSEIPKKDKKDISKYFPCNQCSVVCKSSKRRNNHCMTVHYSRFCSN